MQKSLKNVISKAFTILFFLVAYSLRTLAQEEKVKAFKEGDHVFSVNRWVYYCVKVWIYRPNEMICRVYHSNCIVIKQTTDEQFIFA